MALFQTIGALGEAKGLFAHAEAVATTTLVLVLATAMMSVLALRRGLAGPGSLPEWWRVMGGSAVVDGWQVTSQGGDWDELSS